MLSAYNTDSIMCFRQHRVLEVCGVVQNVSSILCCLTFASQLKQHQHQLLNSKANKCDVRGITHSDEPAENYHLTAAFPPQVCRALQLLLAHCFGLYSCGIRAVQQQTALAKEPVTSLRGLRRLIKMHCNHRSVSVLTCKTDTLRFPVISSQ